MSNPWEQREIVTYLLLRFRQRLGVSDSPESREALLRCYDAVTGCLQMAFNRGESAMKDRLYTHLYAHPENAEYVQLIEEVRRWAHTPPEDVMNKGTKN